MRVFLPILFSAFVFSLHGAVDRTKKPEPGPAPEAAFPDYTTKVLANGLRVFVIEDDRKPTITMRLVIKAGDAYDAGKPGTAGFVASLLNRGTATRDAQTFAKTVDSLGATLEASAGPDAISVSTGGLTKVTDPLFDLFADAVLRPVFAEDEFAKAQKRAISGLMAQKKEPRALVGKLMSVALFAGHPYGSLTTPESVKALNRDDLVKFHSTWFAPNNASLAIVGDVKSADILPKIEKALGDWKKKELPVVEKSALKPIEGLTIHLIDLPGSVQSNVIVSRHAPSRAGTPDLPEVNVMNSILGGGFSGRLFQNLREKNGYTYGSSSAFGYNRDAGYFQATAETRNNVTAAAITEILSEITRIMTESVADPELDLQRQYNIGNYLLSLESAGRVASRVQDIDLYGLPADFYKTYAKRMASVTPERVKELAGKYLSSKDIAIVVVGDASQVKADLDKLGKVVVYDTDVNLVK